MIFFAIVSHPHCCRLTIPRSGWIADTVAGGRRGAVAAVASLPRVFADISSCRRNDMRTASAAAFVF
ncbi:MAG: hypothetical protein D6757_03005 [Alphaproteobacteria bacterium]|nr:MAG: hypothetical protein D6757_03005 [Alphaproteobacteria bacterium]